MHKTKQKEENDKIKQKEEETSLYTQNHQKMNKNSFQENTPTNRNGANRLRIKFKPSSHL